MKLFPGHPYFETALWAVMGVSSVLLFFFAATVIALLLRQKRYRWLWLALPILALAYFMEQCFGMAMNGGAHTQTAADIVSHFAGLPDWLLLSACLLSRRFPICPITVRSSAFSPVRCCPSWD